MKQSTIHRHTLSPPSTRASLLAQLRNGSAEAAWRLFVELYTPIVYHYCRRRGLQDADSRDVTQHVFARVFQAAGKFDYDPAVGRFRSWLGTIVAREIIRYRQRGDRLGKGAGNGEGDFIAERVCGPVDADWLDEFNTQIMRTALKRIRGRFDDCTWQAFEMTWLGTLEPDDAAQRLGKTLAWIYKARFRVVTRLRAEVEFLAEDEAALHRPA